MFGKPGEMVPVVVVATPMMNTSGDVRWNLTSEDGSYALGEAEAEGGADYMREVLHRVEDSVEQGTRPYVQADQVVIRWQDPPEPQMDFCAVTPYRGDVQVDRFDILPDMWWNVCQVFRQMGMPLEKRTVFWKSDKEYLAKVIREGRIVVAQVDRDELKQLDLTAMVGTVMGAILRSESDYPDVEGNTTLFRYKDE